MSDYQGRSVTFLNPNLTLSGQRSAANSRGEKVIPKPLESCAIPYNETARLSLVSLPRKIVGGFAITSWDSDWCLRAWPAQTAGSLSIASIGGCAHGIFTASNRFASDICVDVQICIEPVSLLIAASFGSVFFSLLSEEWVHLIIR
jgi:hypothetical protein